MSAAHARSTNRELQTQYKAADDAVSLMGPSAWVKRKCRGRVA